MLDSKVREYILSLDDNKDLPDDEIVGYILEQNVIWEGDYDKRRHWTNCFCVCKIGDMFIGYESATGGEVHDRGWEFDPSTICEMEEYIEPVKKYRVKEMSIIEEYHDKNLKMLTKQIIKNIENFGNE